MLWSVWFFFCEPYPQLLRKRRQLYEDGRTQDAAGLQVLVTMRESINHTTCLALTEIAGVEPSKFLPELTLVFHISNEDAAEKLASIKGVVSTWPSVVPILKIWFSALFWLRTQAHEHRVTSRWNVECQHSCVYAVSDQEFCSSQQCLEVSCTRFEIRKRLARV